MILYYHQKLVKVETLVSIPNYLFLEYNKVLYVNYWSSFFGCNNPILVDDASKFTFNNYSMEIILNGSTSKRTQKGEWSSSFIGWSISIIENQLHPCFCITLSHPFGFFKHAYISPTLGNFLFCRRWTQILEVWSWLMWSSYMFFCRLCEVEFKD
jgi:hypothetical protein